MLLICTKDTIVLYISLASSISTKNPQWLIFLHSSATKSCHLQIILSFPPVSAPLVSFSYPNGLGLQFLFNWPQGQQDLCIAFVFTREASIIVALNVMFAAHFLSTFCFKTFLHFRTYPRFQWGADVAFSKMYFSTHDGFFLL